MPSGVDPPARDVHFTESLAAAVIGEHSSYLHCLGAVFGTVATLLRPGGYAVLNLATITTDLT